MVQKVQQWLFSIRRARVWGIAGELIYFTVCWNLEKVNSNASEAMTHWQNLPVRVRKAGRRQGLSPSVSLYVNQISSLMSLLVGQMSPSMPLYLGQLSPSMPLYVGRLSPPMTLCVGQMSPYMFLYVGQIFFFHILVCRSASEKIHIGMPSCLGFGSLWM